MADSRTVTPGRYMVQLDGLRGLAAIAVVLQHTIVAEGPRSMILNEWQPRLGVRLFFVLSGFLITGILLRSRDEYDRSSDGLMQALKTFYIRRSLRIFPLYYLVLFVTAAIVLPSVRDDFLWHFFYLTNYLACKLGTLAHFWSLAVEEQFYLVWPAFIFFVPRKWLAPAIACLFVLSNLSYVACMRLTYNGIMAMVLTTSNIDTLMCGAMLALLHYRGNTATTDRLCNYALLSGILLGLAHLGLSLMGKGWAPAQGFVHASNALMFTWLVNRAAVGFGGIGRVILEFPPLIYIGTISYGIYVYHLLLPFAIRWIVRLAGGEPSWAEGKDWKHFAITMIATIFVAGLSWKFFEKPLNDLKRYFPYGSAPTGRVPDPARIARFV